jgi:outer membrane protein TolC
MKLKILIILVLISSQLNAQKVLEDYIRYGLDNNLSLQQKQSGFRKSIAALKEAKGLFYPKISLEARYTISEGGRTIDFPVGDLLNPVYMTLNSLTYSSMFPTIENQEIRFLRPHEHETKLRLVQPIINNDIYFNSKIKQELVTLDEEDVSQYKRELIAEIKNAYYNAAMAHQVLNMLRESRILLTENVRVNKKLIENQKVTLDYLYRSETELSKFDQELQDAEKNEKIAYAYFNFLLNKPLTDNITIEQPESYPALSEIKLDYSESALQNREELKKLETYGNISNLKVKMNNTDKLPDMFVAIDYGFQGTRYRFNKEQDYLQASAVLSWNLFSGFQSKSRLNQAKLDKETADRKLEETRKQIELQVINTMNELLTAEKGIAAAEARLRNAKEAFRLLNRKYEEGQASQIEFIDSRTSLTQAEENLIISRFRYLSSFAEFERASATGDIK